MEAFQGSNPVCPKCLHGPVRDKYKSPSAFVGRPECLVRSCCGCGYSWREHVAESQEQRQVCKCLSLFEVKVISLERKFFAYAFTEDVDQATAMAVEAFLADNIPIGTVEVRELFNATAGPFLTKFGADRWPWISYPFMENP